MDKLYVVNRVIDPYEPGKIIGARSILDDAVKFAVEKLRKYVYRVKVTYRTDPEWKERRWFEDFNKHIKAIVHTEDDDTLFEIYEFDV